MMVMLIVLYSSMMMMLMIVLMIWHNLYMNSVDVDPKTAAAGVGGVEVGVVSLYEACLAVNPPHFQYAARTLSIACEELGGTEGHITATASLILALEFLYLSTTHYSLKNAFECFEFCLRIEGMLRVHSTALIEEMEEKASSGSHSSSPTALLEYSRTIKQKALDLISSRRGKSRSSTNSGSNSSSLPRPAADGDSNGVDRSEARETSHADLFLGSHLVPFLIELGISWLFAERRYNVEPSISADTPSTSVHPEAEVVAAAVDASQAESVHYADTSYDDDDPSRSKTHGLLLSKKASASSAVTSEVLRECVEGNAHRYLAMEALELEYGASTVGRVICQPTTGAVATPPPPHKEDGFGGGGADAVRHWMCSRGLTLSLVVIIIRDLLCCEYQFFTTAVVITMFSRNRCFQEDVLSLLLQMYTDEDILNYDERDDGSSSRHSQTITDSDSTRGGGRYSPDEKLRRILHVFGLTSIIRRMKMMMKGEEKDEHSSLQQVEGMNVQLLLLRAVSPQYIRRVVVEAAAHTHTSSHGGAGAMSTGGGYFELMPLSDHHHHHPLHADLASAAALEPSSSSYSLLSLLKSLVLSLLLVRDRDTASLLLRTISIYITAKVDPSLHLALSMDGEEHTSNEAILRALL